MFLSKTIVLLSLFLKDAMYVYIFNLKIWVDYATEWMIFLLIAISSDKKPFSRRPEKNFARILSRLTFF